MAACASLHARPSFAEPPSATSSARSEEKTLEQRRAKAKLKYQQGAEAYSAGSYSDAVDLFLEADRLAPSAPLSFNVARAYGNLGDEAGALRWYRDYLRRAPEAENAFDVRVTVAALASAMAKKGVQQLTVLSNPAGATVAIDGRPLGVAPWTGELSPGKHHVSLTLRGYTDAERNLTLPANEPIDVSAELERAPVVDSPLAPGGAARGPQLGVLPWVSLGAGAAVLGGALTFELMRRSAENDAHDQITQLGYKDSLESEQSRQTTARVLLGVGSAFVAAGGIMLLLDAGSTPQTSTASAGLVCLPSSCSVSARGRF
jgi:tetratricopeptide (TPR) repeat protein